MGFLTFLKKSRAQLMFYDITGALKKIVIDLKEDEYMIGRAEGNEIALFTTITEPVKLVGKKMVIINSPPLTPDISKNHGILKWNGTSYTYTDISRNNKSRINGKKIGRGTITLENKDDLKLGKEIQFEYLQ